MTTQKKNDWIGKKGLKQIFKGYVTLNVEKKVLKHNNQKRLPGMFTLRNAQSERFEFLGKKVIALGD